MTTAEMPIFTRTFDFLTWLLPATNNFPRAHRHTFTQRLLNAAFDLREQLEAANHRMGRERLAQLQAADQALDRVRLYVRLAAVVGMGSPTPRAAGRVLHQQSQERPRCGPQQEQPEQQEQEQGISLRPLLSWLGRLQRIGEITNSFHPEFVVVF